MSAEIWPEGIGRVILAETDTTNAEAARRAASGHAEAWILAGFQTAGRGRRGRPWISPRGNFHASLLMRPYGPPAEAALRSFFASLALAEALDALTGAGAGLQLKWPNDLLLAGGKVSGILLESLGQGAETAHLVVGIGVNLIAAPDAASVEPGAVRPVSVLEATGKRIAPAALLDALAPAFARLEALYAAEGFAPIRAAWLARAARLGTKITARTGTTSREGIFETIDDGGALVLQTPEGRIALPAADIFF